MSDGLREALVMGLTMRHGVRLSEKETAGVLGMSIDHLRQRARKNVIVPVHDGKRVFYPVTEIVRYGLESHE